MDPKLLIEFESFFESFRFTNNYRDRKKQFCFANVARQILDETLKVSVLTNELLTGLIHMFKWDCSDANFDKYLEQNVTAKTRRQEISVLAYDKCGENGYTGAGKRKIRGLDKKQLEAVKRFLQDAFQIKTVVEAKKLCEDFDFIDVPEVKIGIYSPWLYYINPKIFPIINTTHIPFLKWSGTPYSYSECITLYHEINKVLKEEELGTIDAFTFQFHKNTTGKTGVKKLELKGATIFKMSHGVFVKRADFKKAATADELYDANWICLNENTGKGQAELFQNAKIGDYIFLCYGGDSLGCIGKITSAAAYIPDEDLEIVANDEGWIYRKIDPLFDPVNEDISDFKSERSYWMPSGNSTFYPIPNVDLDYANEHIFLPKYNVRILNTDLNVGQESLNTILYGPPGTGKTYNTIIRAAEIINSESLDYKTAKGIYDQLFGDQVEFITFHQNYSYEDFVIGLKPDIKKDILHFTNREGVFFQICKRARDNYFAFKQGLHPSEPMFQKVLYEFLKPLQHENEGISVKMDVGKASFLIIGSSGDFLSFQKESSNDLDVLKIETLKALYYAEMGHDTDGKHIYYTPLVMRLRHISETLKKETEPVALKNYVLIIDEINRANISRVFGELITLLEDDKRLGNKHEMNVTLSNGDKFSVPKNLYLIGTMNTADKSIALIDIALRRRFVFQPMYPDYTLVDSPYKEFLQSLNDQILEKKNADFLIGHSYLMAEDGEQLDFVSALNYKIIPLLNEYFYNQRNVSVLDFLQTAIAKVPGFEIVKDTYTGAICKKLT